MDVSLEMLKSKNKKLFKKLLKIILKIMKPMY